MAQQEKGSKRLPADSPAVTVYIETVGDTMAAFGLPRLHGRVFGALLVADPPEQSAEMLVQTLQASRSGIGAATQLLEHLGYITRTGKRGERKDYFRVRPKAWTILFKQQYEGIVAFRKLAERGLDTLESNNPEVRRGLEELRDFYAFWEREQPDILRRWERELEAKRGKARTYSEL